MKRNASLAAHAPVAERLIEAGERLIGQHGVEGVTLRQLSLQAGTGNNYAVQYHFGDLWGLIEAILARRFPEIERLRGVLLAQSRSRQQLDLAALVRALLLPPLEIRDRAGERVYARFVGAVMSSEPGMQCISRADHLAPVSHELISLIAQQRPDIPFSLLRERLRLVFLMVLTSVFNRTNSDPDPALDTLLIEDALLMASSALAAPTPAVGWEALPARPGASR